MELKLAPRMFEALIRNLRHGVSEIRQLEKEIMVIAVRDAGMPRKEFILSFPEERDLASLGAEADQGRQEVVGRDGPPAGGNLAPPGQARRAREDAIT